MKKFLLELWRDQRGAVTVTTTLAGKNAFAATVTATADADVTTGNIAHGLSAAPLIYGITQILSQALAAMSNWALTTVNATNLVGTKLATTGSGNGSPQILIFALLPHSLIS